VLSTLQARLRTAADAVAVGAFLMLWLTVWPFWLVRSHYWTLPSRSSSRHGGVTGGIYH
jgi:glucose dehydrogenase